MEKDRLHKEQQKENYDHSHRVKTAAILPDNTDVWVNTQGRNVPGTVVTTPPLDLILLLRHLGRFDETA